MMRFTFGVRSGPVLRTGAKRLALMIALVWAIPAEACNVPVFRYALERWRPDLYELVIFHDGTLGPAQQKLITTLQEFTDRPDGCPTNLGMEVVDVGKKMDKGPLRLWASQKNPTVPWMVVRYPAQTDIKVSLHEGPLDGAVLKKLFDSPLRRTLTDKLLRGETAVWVFIDSGDKEKDDEKAIWLNESLAKLEKTLKLPELTETPKDKLQTDVALKIEFSVVRVSRQDPAEAHLVRMLLNMEDDLEETKEPIVFPVFGRGMALWAIVGKGIIESNVRAAAQFLVGPCSCEIKAQNPGVDLLLTADWEERLTGRLTKTPELPPLTGLIPLETAALSGVPVLSKEPFGDEPSNYFLWREIVLALVAAVIVVIGGTLLIIARRNQA